MVDDVLLNKAAVIERLQRMVGFRNHERLLTIGA